MTKQIITPAELGKRLKLIRQSLKYTQTDCANAIGVQFQQYQKYEKGIHILSSDRLQILAHFLKIEIADLFKQNCKITFYD